MEKHLIRYKSSKISMLNGTTHEKFMFRMCQKNRLFTTKKIYKLQIATLDIHQCYYEKVNISRNL